MFFFKTIKSVDENSIILEEGKYTSHLVTKNCVFNRMIFDRNIT